MWELSLDSGETAQPVDQAAQSNPYLARQSAKGVKAGQEDGDRAQENREGVKEQDEHSGH